MLIISHISNVLCHISSTRHGFSTISGMWLSSRFSALQRQEAHPTSVMLPGMIAFRKTAAYVVPVRLLFLSTCSTWAVLLFCTLPTLFVRRGNSRISQKQSMAKGNLAPRQFLGRFSELLQQL